MIATMIGINTEIGIFPSYVGMESYLPQENWNYTHSFSADFTPYYFAGARGQIFVSQHTKVELWLVNGWQTYGEWHEAKAGGYLIQTHPSESLLLGHNAYFGAEDPSPAAASSVRAYSDNYAQLRYFKRDSGFLRSLAIAASGDIGFDSHTGSPNDILAGGVLAHRAQFGTDWAFTVRGDVYYDKTQDVIYQLPLSSPYSLSTLPGSQGPFLGAGLTTTVDFSPSPWIVFRFEYAHRAASIDYFSGHGGITGPNGYAPAIASDFTPDLRRTDDRLVFNATLRL